MVSINFNNKPLWPNLKINNISTQQDKKEDFKLKVETAIGDTFTPTVQKASIENGEGKINGKTWKWVRRVDGQYVVYKEKKNGDFSFYILSEEQLKNTLDKHGVEYTEK